MERRASRAHVAGRTGCEDRHAALPARQERARMEGARRRVRRPQRTSALALLRACGAIPSSHDYHFNRFLSEAFPHGTGFPPWEPLPPMPELPLAPVRAFSIDDASTTEIDDAFSVRDARQRRHREIGIHIAAPALAIAPRLARSTRSRGERLSTVYMPGRKITMLPERVVDALHAARAPTRPALSLYVETAADGALVGHRTRARARADRRQPAARRDDEAFANERRRRAIRRGPPSSARCGNSRSKLAAARGKPDVARIDYRFYVDWSGEGAGERGRVTIAAAPARESARQARRRADDPRQQHVGTSCSPTPACPGFYRVQAGGKVKMSTRPGEHQGLGVAHYLWASSPLRRYSDLVNQRQLLARSSTARAAVRRRRCGAFRRAGRFRGDLLAVRRVPGPDGALLVPALAAAGERYRDARRPSSATTSCGSIRCRWSFACPTCRRVLRVRAFGWQSGGWTCSTRRSNAVMPARSAERGPQNRWNVATRRPRADRWLARNAMTTACPGYNDRARLSRSSPCHNASHSRSCPRSDAFASPGLPDSKLNQ